MWPKRFFSFVKVEHTLFSVPLIFAGMFLALKGIPSAAQAALILAAATGARTVSFALNRIIDRQIDRLNPRTADRELPAGRMTLWEAAAVLAVGLVVYLTSAALLNTLCLILSPIPLVVFVAYPHMKRFTSLSHFGVGSGLALGALGGWIAVRPSLADAEPGLLLTFFTLFWATGFDIIYSTLDESFDRDQKLYSLPSRLGRKRALQIAALLHIVAFGLLAVLFVAYLKSLPAFPFLILAGVLLYFEHEKAEDVDIAFFKINAIEGFAVLGMVLFGLFA